MMVERVVWFFWQVWSILSWLWGVRVVDLAFELGTWVVVVLVGGSGGCALVWGLCLVTSLAFFVV